MGTQHLSLKWNSHQKNMLDVFKQLLWNEDLVDVTLACEGNIIKAHKTVLSACSSFFHNLFSEYPDKHPIVIMKDMRFSDLKIIVDFMYLGEVIVAHDQLGELLKTADSLKIKGLSESVSDSASGSGECFKAQEVSTNSFNTTPAPTPSFTSTSEQTQSQSNLPVQKKRKRIRQRRRSSSVSSDEHVPSNKIATRTEFIEITEDETTTLKSNNVSPDTSQSSITFHNNINMKNVQNVQLSSSHDSPIDADIPSHTVNSVGKPEISEQQTTEKSILRKTEFVIPEVPLTDIAPLQMIQSHSCSVPCEFPTVAHTLMEGSKDIKQEPSLSFGEQPLTVDTGLPVHESSLSSTNVKFENIPPPNPCVPLAQQAEHRVFEGEYEASASDVFVEEFIEVERQHLYPRLNFPYSRHKSTVHPLLKNPLSISALTKKCKQQPCSSKDPKNRCHICNVCNKKFSDGSNLRRHFRIHSGQRPYSCDHCGRTFTQSTGLHRHERIHLRDTVTKLVT